MELSEAFKKNRVREQDNEKALITQVAFEKLFIIIHNQKVHVTEIEWKWSVNAQKGSILLRISQPIYRSKFLFTLWT